MPINKELNRPVEVKVHVDVWIAAKDRARRQAQNLSAICRAIMLRPGFETWVGDPIDRRFTPVTKSGRPTVRLADVGEDGRAVCPDCGRRIATTAADMKPGYAELMRHDCEPRKRIRFVAPRADVEGAFSRCEKSGTTLSQAIEAGLERYVISGDIDKPVQRERKTT